MIPRLKRTFALILAFTACVKPVRPVPPKVQQLPEEVRLASQADFLAGRAEQLLHRQQELIWKSWIEGTPAELEKTYQDSETLFSVATIRQLENLRQRLLVRFRCTAADSTHLFCPEQAGMEQVRAATYLHTHFVGEYLARLLAEQNAAIANLEASLTFIAKGREYPYRDLERLLTNENSQETRHALYQAATTSARRLAQSIRRREEKTDEVLHELGYPSYQAFGSEIRQVDLPGLGKLADNFLERTEDVYRRMQTALAVRELHTTREKLQRSDLFRAFRIRAELPIPIEQLLPRVDRLLAPMGLQLTGIRNLSIDTRGLETKSSRPITIALEVPSDVRVSVKPTGTLRDQQVLLHELGHALSYAFVTARPVSPSSKGASHPRFELTKLGNRTANQAFALLFESLFEDPQGIPDQAEAAGNKLALAVFSARAHHLLELRRRAGQLLYELQWRQVDPEEAPPLYVQIMSRAYGLPLTPDDATRYLEDRDELFRSADELRAAFLEAELRAYLIQQFGASWWQHLESGNFLRSLWSAGNAWSADELAARIGNAAVDSVALIRRIEREGFEN